MTHRWQMSRMGTLEQVRFEQAADLQALEGLDHTVWVALACPVRGLDMDERTLALIDTDGDGRIRVPEVLAAVRWLCAHLRDPGIIFTPDAPLPLSAVDDTSPSGQRLLRSARRILSDLDLSERDAITIAESGDLLRILAAARFNGDGVVTTASCDNPAVVAAIEDMLECYGGVPDRSEQLGVDGPTLDRFSADLHAFNQWWASAEEGSESSQKLLPLGENTPQAVAAWRHIHAKIEDYFARCRLQAFEPGASEALARGAADWGSLSKGDLSSLGEDIAALPLQRPSEDGRLWLEHAVNPAWQKAFIAFRTQVVTPLLGEQTTLDSAQWQTLQNRLKPHWQWSQAKSAPLVEPLGIQRIRELLQGSVLQQVRELIAEDLAVSDEIDGISDVDRLLRYRRDLARLLRNFVNFDEFYRLDRIALFQAGKLYLD